jgi:hypothetical protein
VLGNHCCTLESKFKGLSRFRHADFLRLVNYLNVDDQMAFCKSELLCFFVAELIHRKSGAFQRVLTLNVIETDAYFWKGCVCGLAWLLI